MTKLTSFIKTYTISFIINRSKECYINNKESILEHLKNKYEFLTEDKKQKLKDYRKEYDKKYYAEKKLNNKK